MLFYPHRTALSSEQKGDIPGTRFGMVLRSTFREHPSEEWWGSSVAAITRSASDLCRINTLSVSDCGIIDAISTKAQRLPLVRNARHRIHVYHPGNSCCRQLRQWQ